MLRQIYLTLDMIADGCFDAADRFHYLKLMYLLFMNNKLEPLSEPIAVFGNEISRAFSFVNALYKLVKMLGCSKRLSTLTTFKTSYSFKT